MESKADRIRQMLAKHELSVNKLAKLIGVAPNAIHQWLKQGISPSDANMEAMAKVFGVEPAWLDWGTRVITAQSEEIVKKYAFLSERDKRIVDVMIDALGSPETPIDADNFSDAFDDTEEICDRLEQLAEDEDGNTSGLIKKAVNLLTELYNIYLNTDIRLGAETLQADSLALASSIEKAEEVCERLRLVAEQMAATEANWLKEAAISLEGMCERLKTDS